MTFLTITFSILIFLLLFRVLLLHSRRHTDKDPSFRLLPTPAKLAVLKEVLLNNPSKGNLTRLEDFCKKNDLQWPSDNYETLLQEQIQISKNLDALNLDNALFEKEAEWLDSITPIEEKEAMEAFQKNDFNLFIEKKLILTLRLYSDKNIERTLEELTLHFPKAKELLQEYLELVKYREASSTDEDSIKKLRSKRDAFERSIEFAIEEVAKLEPTPS